MKSESSYMATDFLRGTYACLAYGDAFGAPFEFRNNNKREVTEELILPISTTSRWQGKRDGVIGQVTDDTEMTITLLEVVVKHGRYDQNDAIYAYMKWVNEPQTMLGINTRKLFKGIRTENGFWRRHENTDFAEIESNGCLMRATGLLPLLFQEDFDEQVAQDVQLTNDNLVCHECVRTYMNAFLHLWYGDSIKLTYHRLRKKITSQKVRDVFDDAWEGVPRQVSGPTKGWILHAFHQTFYHFFNQTPFTKAMFEIVSLRGDTDTNAAIAGALLGARDGFKKLAKDKIFLKNYKKILTADTALGDFPRPLKYHPSRFEDLLPEAVTLFDS